MNADSIAGLDSNSDLLPGIYEGGFKLWECTHDLLEYLSDNIVFNNGDKVFEIGCGSGLLGIQCLLRGAHCVHFQDFNLDVLKWFTIPNIAINCSGVSDKQALFQTRCNFFFGDWRNVKQQLAELNLKYDYIFSSETIYNTQNYSAFVELVKSCLASNGVAFIAAKSYYFGVGGGMHDFEQFIQNDDRLQSSVCATIDASVPRQIIKLHFKA
ncbi:histidine protein methyltransferase 1-like protein [Dinothrombium tinctorium]|uniref:protein-histidine N-methyltransferase n=1 Tax=Dinothrombium tinctorium TaxID=1965070 RepID=A0A3S3NTW4_9ACAR|nr:histidine protein methyltransferase 1-like protein [Dinothrombium tinctorium]RWS03463.1 histidine protein methyltransferase 1-like protein [Dinothrombium tinctorium]